MNRLPFGIGDFVASFKGDTPGHPFRGNQFEGGSGDGQNENDTETPREVSFSKMASYGGHKEMTADKGDYISTGKRVHIVEGGKNSYMLRTRKYSSSGGSDWTTHKTGLPLKEAKNEATKLLNDDSIWK